MERKYAHNVVIDLEFTPVPKRLRRGTSLANEIIEVGAVKLDADGTPRAEFSRMVKPSLTSGVTGSVHHMTGISDEDLTCTRPLGEVLDALEEWIGPGRTRIVTWSDSDLKQVQAECAAKHIEHNLPIRWLDIQRIYPCLMGSERRRRVALGEAADWCGIDSDRSAVHRALYDAQVTAEIFRMMAAGECAEHRRRVDEEFESAASGAVCSASIAERCSGLADLIAMLVAQEGGSVA